MQQSNFIKLTFIPGLKEIVLQEIAKYPTYTIVEENEESLYLVFKETYKELRALKSVIDLYIVERTPSYNPQYLTRHKSVIGALIEKALQNTEEKYRTFNLSCAGADSAEIIAIKEFITEKYSLQLNEEADMKLYIGKSHEQWEIGASLTARPLSFRSYKVENMKGGLNPTIAYAMNTFAALDSKKSYLNIFSGSGTLLIEAGTSNPALKLVGLDNNAKSNSLAIQNIKKAGLIEKIKLTTADIYDAPTLGTFDVIVSDLPFGMSVSKGEDLGLLYERFLDYCAKSLLPEGVLIAYTTEYELFSSKLKHSPFIVTELLRLQVSTSVGAYLYPRIFVCTYKNK